MKVLPVIILLAGWTIPVLAQQQLPVIRATSKTVSIKDGPNFSKDIWTIEPQVKTDIYRTSAKRVVFYTDIDSIVIKVKPGQPQDFYILLNDKDSARTQVSFQPSRLEMLKQAKKYNFADKRTFPGFTYQSPDDSVLKRIREEFKLDSVAGSGNEVSRIINLMQWVHNTIRHDGNTNNPTIKNAIDIIGICKQEGRAVNCRMMATVLNECYLAMGFKSRFLTCMPKEIKFDDCHVINMVYSEDEQKWIWMDPTFNAYVMDEKGGMLGPKEVRERLVNGQPLILNPDANWNRKISQTKAHYLETYMAKNLYRMEAIAGSVYNTETVAAGKWLNYIQLVPLDGLNQEGKKTENPGRNSYATYITNNPDLFWAKP